MGGRPAGKVELSEHDYAEWERRVDALMTLLGGVKGDKKLMTVDELRKNVEALGPDAYDKMSYYERWVTSITQTMIQRGVITTEELGRKMEQVRAKREKSGSEPDFRRERQAGETKSGSDPDFSALPVRFALGERVRVRDTAPLGHIRTPFYIRGHVGTIERLCGNFPMPEELAQMRSGLPAQPLYRVRFLQREVWPDYRGRADDVVEIEIFQHWLEKA